MSGTTLLITFFGAWVAIVWWGYTKRISVWLSAGGGLIGAYAVMALVGMTGNLFKPEAPDAWKEKDSSSMAYIMMQDFVTERLKAPATAQFPGVLDGRDQHVKPLGDQRYYILSYVDAQNSFGANIRTYFEGRIQQTAKDKWKLEALQLK